MHIVDWRDGGERNDTTISDLPDLIVACCVLHKLCEIHRERFNEEWLQEVDTRSINTVDNDSNASHGSAENIRKAYFKDN